jgi:hypothetical protein
MPEDMRMLGSESVSGGTRLLMLLGCLFFVSCFKACEAIRYRLSGKDAAATVSQIA